MADDLNIIIQDMYSQVILISSHESCTNIIEIEKKSEQSFLEISGFILEIFIYNRMPNQEEVGIEKLDQHSFTLSQFSNKAYSG
mgnify:CR=1 FL=1